MNSFKKRLPDTLTVLRIPLSLSLLFIKAFSIQFYIMYSLCILTDILDGYFARRFKCSTRHGQVLDSFGDFILIVVLFYIVLSHIKLPFGFVFWGFMIALVKLVSINAGIIKHRRIYTVHSALNKMTGAVFFVFVFLVNTVSVYFACGILCCIATVASIEELLIILISKKVHGNIKSIFSLKKE